jgi:hypothetical protein
MERGSTTLLALPVRLLPKRLTVDRSLKPAPHQGKGQHAARMLPIYHGAGTPKQSGRPPLTRERLGLDFGRLMTHHVILTRSAA